jgi:hypothetical protein
MKKIRCYLLLCTIFFISCQKEYSVESGAGNTATFTYDGEPNDCLTPGVQGNYTTGIALDASNSVIIYVAVTKPGNYSITTNTINGIKFSGTGSFTVSGIQTVELTGSGTPIAQGSYDFKTATTGCSFTIDILSGGPAAVYTYTSANSNCTGFSISGTYSSGINLGGTNTVNLNVNVTVAGTYNVTTNTLNGVSFSGSGTLPAGLQTIKLTGQGTPTTAGLFTFTPTNNGCAFPITFAAPLPPATYTFAGSPGNCTTPAISGTYTAGTALTAANTVALTVNVTVAGAYSVTTNAVNGVTFSGTGNLTAGANQIITLTSTNTPTAATTVTYTPVDNNSATNIGCNFDIVYDPSTSTGVTGTYSAKIGATNYNFATNNLDAFYLNQLSTLTLYGQGLTTNTDPSFEIYFDNSPNNLVPATYRNITATNLLQTCDISYTDASGMIFNSSPLNNNTFTTIITAVTANSLVGTFSGTLYDDSGLGANSVMVTAGVFNVKF